MIEKKNIFKNLPDSSKGEIFQDIIDNHNFKLESIVSSGQATPDGEWYDQPNDEWVLLLQGSGVLIFEDESESCRMNPGDHILISAHKKHRVEETDKNGKSIWIALHFNYE